MCQFEDKIPHLELLTNWTYYEHSLIIQLSFMHLLDIA